MVVVLAGLVLLFIGLYQFAFVNPKFFAYAMGLRLPRLAVILIAGFAISAAAIVFQTIIRNTIVTPCLLGMNSLYLLIHTAVVFFLGSGSLFAVNPVYAFAADVIVMGVVAGFIYYTIFQKTGGNVLYVLLIGTVLSTFFSSMQNSLTRIMDPNEYDALLNTLTASFTNVNAACIIPGALLLAAIAWWLRKDLAILDVISLGREQAVSLGVDYERPLRRLMVGIALYIAVAEIKYFDDIPTVVSIDEALSLVRKYSTEESLNFATRGSLPGAPASACSFSRPASLWSNTSWSTPYR